MTSKDHFRNLLENSTKIVGFTGAGVSTESGIADYRSQEGIWDQFQPVYLDEFIHDNGKRLLYWQRKLAMWQALETASPGPAHKFFTKLFKKGQLKGLITQNIDGLHEKSGIPSNILVNLHGTSLEIICLGCEDSQPAEGFMDSLDLNKGAPLCKKCNGLLKPNTISFGQNLRDNDIKTAEQLARTCDLIIVAGSTLVVQPAASLPLLAKQHGAKLVIITLSKTPLDSDSDLTINETLGDFLQEFL